MTIRRSRFAAALLGSVAALAPPAMAQQAPPREAASSAQLAQASDATRAFTRIEEITVTARRREESLQEVPIPVSVIGAELLAETGAFNINRLKELVPTLQFYSTNPRNSAINVRGLGAPYGLTNDGIEPGVGFYVDGVFNNRPAAATLDFIDVEQVEILRGPQGTLYGKNTTAGAINITTRRPSFTPESNVELSYGNHGYLQAKASVSGPLTDRIAARFSFAGTQRDGFGYNVRTEDDVNDLNNLGFKGQVLFQASDAFEVIAAGDFTRQRPEGYAQFVAGVAPTRRAANRQFAGIVADLGYQPPSYNAFDRLTDTDSPWRSQQDLGGASLTVNWDVGGGTLSSISAWRFWYWNPSNDRDFIGLPVTTVSAAPSRQNQFSQELRYAGSLSDALNFVVGAFLYRQHLNSDEIQRQEHGAAAARFLLTPSANAATPGLLDGYGQNLFIDFDNDSAAVFGQVDWAITDRLHILPGVRVNWDRKKVDYVGEVYGGLQTTDPALIALQRSILAPQSYAADVKDTNVSGQATVAYRVSDAVNAYATYAKSYKSVGLNLAGVPNDAAGNPALGAAVVKPEDVNHYEIGVKTQLVPRLTANLTVFQTDISDFQAQVQNAAVGVLRGYLANAEKVRVRGAEFDVNAAVSDNFNVFAALAYTEGEYVSFPDAPAPLEGTGGPSPVDISGFRLPGISKWAGSVGAEYRTPARLLGREGDYFLAVDASYRSDFSSSATPSDYLNVQGYALANARVGFRAADGWDLSLWVRNIADKDYYELLSAVSGGSGLYVGQPGDPRTYGVTVKARF